jgi:hypothetical protein
MLCYPVLLFAAIFLALFGAQIISRDNTRALVTFVFGLVLSTILAATCTLTSQTTTWGLFVVFATSIILYTLVQGGIFSKESTPTLPPTFCPCSNTSAKETCSC